MNKMLLTIGLTLAMSAVTALAQQGQGNEAQRRERAHAAQRGDHRPGDREVGPRGERRGRADGENAQGRRARGPRDGSGPRGQKGDCDRPAQD